jgi:AraC family transcriptional regulator
MFSYLAGMPLSEYIRKRRLSLAVELLCSSDEKIIDISLKCGYETPDSFGKAFQAMYGVPPSAVRKDFTTQTAFPPLFFHLILKGGIKMEYRVAQLGEFYLMGKVGRIPFIFHGANPHTANVWKQLKQEDLLVLMEYSEVDPKGILTVHEQGAEGGAFKFQEGDEMLYGVGVVMKEPMPGRFKGRFDTLPFEASTWFVFSSMDNTRDSSIPSTKEVYARISEWLPTSEYIETGAPIITWTDSYDFSKPDRKTEIWVSVRKRS